MSNFLFYHAENNPASLSGEVGGSMSETLMTNSLNELFLPVDQLESSIDPFYQYRKFWVDQIAGSYTGLYIELYNVENTGRYSFTTGSETDTATSPTGLPAGILDGDFLGDISDTIYIGTGVSGSSFSVWVRQKINSGESPDELDTIGFRIIEQ